MKKCCNLADENTCIPLDCPCVMLHSSYSLAEGKILCKWFRDAVLPTDPALERECSRTATSKADGGRKNVKVCPDCGKGYMPTSPRQQRCIECGKEYKLKARREQQRKRRTKAKE